MKNISPKNQGHRFFGTHKKRNILLSIVLLLFILIGFSIWATANGTFITVEKGVEKKCLAEVKDKKFCKFAAHLSKIGDYQSTVNTSSDSTPPASATTSGSKDGNIQEVETNNGQEAGTIVVYNGTTYTKGATDQGWTQYGSSSANKPSTFDVKNGLFGNKGDFKGEKGQKLHYAYVGDASCGNLTCHKYQITDTANTADQATVLFGTSDFQLYQFDAKANGTNIHLTMTYQPVSIIQPVPVKNIIP